MSIPVSSRYVIFLKEICIVFGLVIEMMDNRVSTTMRLVPNRFWMQLP